MEYITVLQYCTGQITMRSAKCRLEWCKACRHWTLEQWKRVLWSDASHFTISQTDKSGFGGCQENSTYPNATPSNTFGINWNADCEPGLIAQHQCPTSLILLWLNGSPQHLVERLPRIVEAVLAAKGGPTPY
jgi:hypothetical protein